MISSRESGRERLEGSMLAVCSDCRSMVLQVMVVVMMMVLQVMAMVIVMVMVLQVLVMAIQVEILG